MLKNILGRFDNRLDITEEKISEFKDVEIESIPNEAQKKKKTVKKMNKASTSCEKTSGSLTFVYLELLKGGAYKNI